MSGEPLYLTTSPAVREFLDLCREQPRIAVDLEADSLHSYREKVCLVQISIPGVDAVLDPLQDPGWIPELAGLLEDPAVEKVMHGADYDIRLLKKDHGIAIQGVFDTMVAARFTGRTRFGLSALLEEFFGVRLEKRHQQADWSARPLSGELLAYAAADTHHLLGLRDRLVAELEALGRLEWVLEECMLLETAEPARPGRPTVWRVKGATELPPRALAVLQALLELRDAHARRLDRPPFKVLPTALLLRWARTPPRSRAEIVAATGAPRRVLERLADPVLEAVRRALELPPGAWPRPPARNGTPLPAPAKRRLRRLKRVRSRIAGLLGLDPGLLVNSETLEQLARLEPPEAPGWLRQHLKQWQHRVLAGPLLAALGSPEPPRVPAPLDPGRNPGTL